MAFCTNCGNDIGNSKFCKECGEKNIKQDVSIKATNEIEKEEKKLCMRVKNSVFDRESDELKKSSKNRRDSRGC